MEPAPLGPISSQICSISCPLAVGAISGTTWFESHLTLHKDARFSQDLDSERALVALARVSPEKRSVQNLRVLSSSHGSWSKFPAALSLSRASLIRGHPWCDPSISLEFCRIMLLSLCLSGHEPTAIVHPSTGPVHDLSPLVDSLALFPFNVISSPRILPLSAQ